MLVSLVVSTSLNDSFLCVPLNLDLLNLHLLRWRISKHILYKGVASHYNRLCSAAHTYPTIKTMFARYLQKTSVRCTEGSEACCCRS